MHRFSRTVLGYHGCLKAFAAEILSGERTIDEWRESTREWDWLGRGIYFWEHAPERALRWAKDHAQRNQGEPAVIGAVIDLGRCFDLTDLRFAEKLGETYRDVEEIMTLKGQQMPVNKGGDDLKNRQLDCLVINACLAEMPEIQTIRSPFAEGGPAYPGAMITKEAHIQVAIRDRSCILGIFRPTLSQ